MEDVDNQALEIYADLMQHSSTEFNAVRDLPLYGRKQWERHFQKAFQVYARLWSFQQENRAALQDEGLKRWEIGEVASRIGQVRSLTSTLTSPACLKSSSERHAFTHVHSCCLDPQDD
jgi:hypothetical protein